MSPPYRFEKATSLARSPFAHAATLTLLAGSAPLAAQKPVPPSPPVTTEQLAETEAGSEGDTIVVTGQRLRGEVDTDIPAETELTEADISSYGASSIADLLTALAPQTGSARGRGGGQPVVLINGQRVSGFRELRDLPPEAIERVQVFPEELALQYGYRPDQRVINFILKDDYRSLALEAGYGFATQGRYETNELEATLTRIGKSQRLNLNADFEPTSGLLQSDRGILQTRTDALGVDEGRYRTLLPATDPLQLNATLSRNLGTRTSLSLTAGYDLTNSRSLLGLPSAGLTVPGTSPFSRTGTDERITRLFAAGGGLRRESRAGALSLAANANGQLGEWRWTGTLTYDRGLTRDATERQPDAGDLIAGVASGVIDPFDPALTLPGARTTDTTRSLSGRTQATGVLTGSPFRLPAGDAQATLTAEGRNVTLDTRARGRVASDVGLTRRGALVRGNVVLPVTSRREGFGDALGTLSLNANGGVQELSDFGRLTEYGYGLTWEPIEKLSLIASVIGEQAAPTLTQLGAPFQLTPNALVFDGRTGGTVLADLVTGGNRDLRRESRRDTKYSLTWSPGERGEKSFVVEYLTNRSSNVTAGFPLLTPAIEAAFPDRVTRDATGRLVQLDSRPVTFDRLRSSRLRYGFSLSGSIGPEPERGGRFGGGRGGGAAGDGARSGGGAQGGGTRRGQRPTGEGAAPGRAATTTATPPAGAPGTGTTPATPESQATPPAAAPAKPAPAQAGVFFGGRRNQGRWNVSVYDVWQLRNRVLIRPGVAELDLLGGDVTDGSTPIARHQVQLEGGVFKGGIGVRLVGAYTSNAVLADSGTGLPAARSGNLAFGDLATLSTRVFVDFDQRDDVLKALPVLKNSRLVLRVDNLFGGVRRVVDGNGLTPISYQPGFLDPRGRFVEISLRKRF